MKPILTTVLLFTSIFFFGQTSKYPKEDFISPMNIPLEPSGTFGELRSNHFHAGLDFKTNKREGYEIYAAADGFISRIKYSTFGYGKAIYITHYNGYTTVYAHMQKAAPEFETYIKNQQYKNSSFEIELYPKKEELKVKKGQLIGYSGNSGSSGGPHLHFEYRDTASEDIINPLLFGLDKNFIDTKAPLLNNLYVYPLTDSTVVNKSEKRINLAFNKVGNNSFIANKIQAKGTLGIGINSYDMYDGHFNKNGIYKITMIVNGSPFYNVTFDRFSFAESRYINSYIDYEHKEATGDFIQKLFTKEQFPLSLISNNKTKGKLEIKPGDNYNVIIKIQDIHNNTTDITIPIVYDSSEATIKNTIQKTDYFVVAARENMYEKENVTVTIPKGTFVEDFYLDFDVNNSTVKLHKDIIPAYQNMTIEIDAKELIEKGLDPKKSFIALVEKNKITHVNTQVKGTKFSAKTKTLGKYQILTDIINPRIFGLNFKEGDNLDTKDSIVVYISDDLSGIKSYAGYLNGKWILMDYDYKTKSLIHYFSDAIYEDGKNVLKIMVTDKAGNSSSLDASFYKTKN